MESKRKITAVSALHYLRLVYRSALFILLLITYIRYRLYSEATVLESAEKLCVHKKQLSTLWKQIEEYSAKRIKRLKKQ